MWFNVAGFTLKAPSKGANQDRVLVQDQILECGSATATGGLTCRCFVADGIGGTRAGEVASAFLLEQIRARLALPPPGGGAGLRALLETINVELIAHTRSAPETFGAGTTLVGLLHWQDGFRIVNAGDSEAWMLREDRFFRLTEEQVLNDLDAASPLTSYFGGTESELALSMETTLREVRPGDLVLLCSDGLFKVLGIDQVKAVLSNNLGLAEKVRFLQSKIEERDAPDDTSGVLIQAAS